MPEIIINDTTSNDIIYNPAFGRGLVSPDITARLRDFSAPPSEIPIIPRSEWDARLDEQIKTKSRLSDIRDFGNNGAQIPSLNQDKSNYCWGHSTTSATIICRAKCAMPYIPLSAYGVCATIKKGANEGGWCGLSAEFARTKGIPSQAVWPQGQFNYRNYDKPEVWADALLYKTQEDWVDITRPPYEQNLTFDQVATCLLLGYPCPVDFNWWSHSVCAVDLVRIEAGSYGLRIWNSWGDQWSEKGMGLLQGQKAIPNDACCLRTIVASAGANRTPVQTAA